MSSFPVLMPKNNLLRIKFLLSGVIREYYSELPIHSLHEPFKS